MVENITNITNVTSASNGFIQSMLHSQEFWIALIVGVALLVGGIMIKWFFVWRPQRLKKLFDDVKITNNGDTCQYPQNPSWLKYSQARTHLKIHGAWRLWKKIESAKGYYEEVKKEVKRELAEIVYRDVWSKVGFDIEPWNGKGDIPLRCYWCDFWDGEYRNYNLVDAIINKSPLEEVEEDIRLYGINTGYIAKTATISEREELKRLILAVMTVDETKKLVKKVNDAKDAVEKAEKVFKKKLAKIVLNLNYMAAART
jgi:hypothetical protein